MIFCQIYIEIQLSEPYIQSLARLGALISSILDIVVNNRYIILKITGV